MVRIAHILLTTALMAPGLAAAVPPAAPSTDGRLVTEILGATSSGDVVFRRGPSLYRLDSVTREASPVGATPIGPLTMLPVGLVAPGGTAVLYPTQSLAAGMDGAAPEAPTAIDAIATDRPIRLVRIDGDGDEVIGELVPRCPRPRAGRRAAPGPTESTPPHVTLDLHVAWTAHGVLAVGTLACGAEVEPFLFAAPLRPPIADGAHSAVAATVAATTLPSVPARVRAEALAALEPGSASRLLVLAEAHALAGEPAPAIATLWRLSALGPAGHDALATALTSEWAASLAERATFHALVLTTPRRADTRSRPPEAAPDGAIAPPQDSP